MKFKGIGEAKAISIAAALEIGRRRSITSPQTKPIITSSKDAYDLMRSTINDMAHEEMWVILLNKGNKLIRRQKMSSGGTTATIADVKMILKAVVETQAQSIILVHNHPSGSLSPSRADIEITNKIKEAVKYFDITLMDHIIVADIGYYSFIDQGIL
jgi:DNA repair protein RadC